MDNGVLMTAGGAAVGHGLRVRVPAVVVAAALVFAALFLVQHRAEAAPIPAVATASVAAAAAQINIAQIVCPILLAVRATLASIPFFAVAIPTINALLSAFGCAVSGG